MVKAAVKEKGRGMNAATAGSSADRKKRRYEQCTDPTVELVKKMKKDVERNKQTTQRLYNRNQSIVDNSGSLVVSESAITSIGHGGGLVSLHALRHRGWVDFCKGSNALQRSLG